MHNLKIAAIVLSAVMLTTGTVIFAAPDSNSPASAPAKLYVGWATESITPQTPVALSGQLYLRVAEEVENPITCTALALETRNGDESAEQAILVSCDLLAIRGCLDRAVKDEITQQLPGFDPDKLLLNATHTHEAPCMQKTDWYEIPDDITSPAEYTAFAAKRIARAARRAWQNRRPAGMSWGISHAVIGHNRRANYVDGKSKMYGDTSRKDFRRIEGGSDHTVKQLFFFDPDDHLTGIVINIPCPAQENEHLKRISADFWHETRNDLKKLYGKDLFVLAQCGAAGDQSPHLMLRKKPIDSMRKRKQITRTQQIADRICAAVQQSCQFSAENAEAVIFEHRTENIELPCREESQSRQIEVHVLRLGDVAIASNPFELYLDYGLRIETRSDALLTLVTQLSSDYLGYLPTELADRAGGYSTQNTLIAPDGGEVLVNQTVKYINQMWN